MQPLIWLGFLALLLVIEAITAGLPEAHWSQLLRVMQGRT